MGYLMQHKSNPICAYLNHWEQGVILPLGCLATVFADGMGLGALGIARDGRAWRVVTGSRAHDLRHDDRRWFCGSIDRADMVASDARKALCNAAAPSIETVADAITSSARSLGVLIVQPDSIRQHAERIMQSVETEFARLSASGELKSVNRRYREYRLRTEAASQKPIGYPTFIANYKASLVRAAAQHSRIEVFENGK